MKKIKMINCYNCGNKFEKNELTKEHIPPRCFSDVYPEEFKTNRITVPCCDNCNNEFSKIDSELRNFIAILKDGNDGNIDFLQKSVSSIIKSKQLGEDYSFDEKVGQYKIAFNYEHFEKLFEKCHKGIFYKKFGFPVDHLFVSRTSQKMINEKHNTPGGLLIENLHKENPDSFITSGSDEIFKASILAFKKGENNKFEVTDNLDECFAISSYLVFHDLTDCLVFGIKKDGEFYEKVKPALRENEKEIKKVKPLDSTKSDTEKESLNFIEQIIHNDLETNPNVTVHTRFPPEPNGFLHIGHVKAICINFETAKKYGGKTNLRFDDTNPLTEKTLYVDNIKNDIKWLGYDWEDREYYASDYFQQLYEYAVDLIKKGYAYVDESTPEQIAEMKGTPTSPGVDSPARTRSVEENLRLFEEMKNGEHPDGSMVLRAKVDMKHPNMLMRDPNIYRIKKADHHRTGDAWCIYPLYDFAHGQSDSIENITYSLCSLEFRHHRDFYNWLIEKLEIFPSRQIEFARMNVEFMITSKRRLLKLVNDNLVTGWDDPRMPTISGMRRKGYPAPALRTFVDKVGVAKRDNLIEIGLLESCVRDELNKTTARVMGVLDPLKLVITNYPEGQVEQMEAVNNPGDESMGTRTIPFSRELYIEQDDFMEDAPKKFFRLGPGKTVRLKNGYIITCEDFKKDENGKVIEVHCKYYPDSRSGSDTSGIKAKGVLHWVSIEHAVKVTVHNYARLFTVEQPLAQEGKDFMEFFNQDSLEVLENVYVEPSLLTAKVGDRFQFMRKGYYCLDTTSTADNLVFNSTVGLKDSWAKKNKK